MGRFQPVLPLLNNNITRRRGRTWHILGFVVLLFLFLTFIAVRYLPTVVIDPVSVLANRDFKDIFVPPIPRPPLNWPNQHHNHSLHLSDEQLRLRQKIHENKDNLIDLDGDNTNNNNNNNKKKKNPNENLDKIPEKSGLNKKTENLSSHDNVLPVDNLTQIFSHMSIDELKQITSVQMRREKAREVCFFVYFFFFVLFEIRFNTKKRNRRFL